MILKDTSSYYGVASEPHIITVAAAEEWKMASSVNLLRWKGEEEV